MQRHNSFVGTLLWGGAGLIALVAAWTRLPVICGNDNCTSFITAAQYFEDSFDRKNRLLNPAFRLAQVAPPTDGESCEEMQRYFNKNFGRSDTHFSNYEGSVATNFLGELHCDGGVVIQSLPTAKKTCSAAILYNPQTQGLRWYTDNAIANCFVSQ